MLSRLVAGLAFAFISQLAGCVAWPVIKVVQPEASALVVDADGQAIAGARVMLIAKRWYGKRHSKLHDLRAVKVTDRAGRVKFEQTSEIGSHRCAMVPHGSGCSRYRYEYAWCVVAGGFNTYLTPGLFEVWTALPVFNPTPRFVMQPGRSYPCPNPLVDKDSKPLPILPWAEPVGSASRIEQ